jgi:hypothetical protein
MAFAEAGVETDRINDAYLDAALPMAVQIALGRQALHASGVLSTHGVVAFCGDSQSGKTTIACGLSQRGNALWADDVVALDTGGRDHVASLRVPFELNIRPASADYFGGTEQSNGSYPKAEEWQRAPVRAFCVLERPAATDRQGSFAVERLAPRESLIALLSHAWVFRPLASDMKRRMMRDYLDVIARAPVYRLRYSREFGVLPRLLDAIEETLEALP